jgi:ribosomal protein S8
MNELRLVNTDIKLNFDATKIQEEIDAILAAAGLLENYKVKETITPARIFLEIHNDEEHMDFCHMCFEKSNISDKTYSRVRMYHYNEMTELTDDKETIYKFLNKIRQRM